MNKTRIGVIGLGYVGLVTAACFAHKGYRVTCMDVDEEKLNSLRSGKMPIYEPHLQGYFSEGVASNKIALFNEIEGVLNNSDIIFFTVGTPSRADGLADLSYLSSAARSIGIPLREHDEYVVFAVKSTVPPGTTEGVVKSILEESSGKEATKDFGLCSNPEFLKEGDAIDDFLHPDIVVIGGLDRKAGDTMESLYRDFYGVELPPIIRTTPSNAELVKYATNAFLAMKIGFANSIADIASRIPGCDSKVVLETIGNDKRIGKQFLRAGLGFGGSCLGKDLRCLIAFSKSKKYDPILFDSVIAVNESQPGIAVELAETLLGSLSGKNVAVLGLAFKPNTDDVREAVSIKVVHMLLKKGAHVTVTDPMAINNAKRIFGDGVTYEESPLECIRGKDCAILVTEWDQYSSIGPEDFKRLMNVPNLVDGRRLYDQAKMGQKLRFAAVGLYSHELTKRSKD